MRKQMARCTYCEKKIEMRPNRGGADPHGMSWFHIKSGSGVEIQDPSHMISIPTGEVDALGRAKKVVIGEQRHYFGDEAPPIWYWEWYLEEHPELSND